MSPRRLTPSTDPYSPQRRTALVLAGTGTAGAYHAGVLRALHEAGVKLDVIAGRGIGAIGALLAAIDGAPRLWEDKGFWRAPAVRSFYSWRGTLRLLAWAVVVALGIVVYGGFLLIICVPEQHAVVARNPSTGRPLLTLGHVVFGVLGVAVGAGTGGAVWRLIRGPRGSVAAPPEAIRLTSDDRFLVLWLALELALYFAITPIPAARRQPSRGHEIKRHRSTHNISGLRFHDRQNRPRR